MRETQGLIRLASRARYPSDERRGGAVRGQGRMKHYKWRYPSMTYAADWYARSEQKAREAIRDWLQVDRLPAGFEIWRA